VAISSQVTPASVDRRRARGAAGRVTRLSRGWCSG
jgi:hypothetical protein